jgi:hypothetical protein
VTRNSWLLAAALTALAAALTWLWWNTYESYTYEEQTEDSREARNDSMLAAKQTLAALGLRARSLNPHDWDSVLESSTGTIVILRDDWAMTESRRERLGKWIRRGGHLVIAAPLNTRISNETADEPTVETLSSWVGVRHVQPEGEATDDWDELKTTVTLGGLTSKVQFRSFRRLESNAQFRIRGADKMGACALERSQGRGTIVVLCGHTPFRNRFLGQEEHAKFLWAISRREHGPAPVWFVSDVEMAGLHKWLWQRAPQAVTLALATLFVWLWSSMRRAGPTRDLPPPARRRITEHITAGGRFAWRYDGGTVLLTAMRGAFNARLERRHPAWANLERTARFARLAAASGLSVDDIHRAVEASATDRRSFINAVKNLNTVWKSL